MFLPIISIFVAFVVVLVLLLLLSFRRGAGRHMAGMHHFSELCPSTPSISRASACIFSANTSLLCECRLFGKSDPVCMLLALCLLRRDCQPSGEVPCHLSHFTRPHLAHILSAEIASSKTNLNKRRKGL